ncbi:LexA/Signal peptidase [Lindgomyces ingoldianus]|uniref:LexA/Signal peptidase n=1 Tax=Lindgomyces ingoldianus TaxID=673940 RepID=A0ACB6R0G4_9PLEO|nr:LexA/Signal peptidase [Lindgomyces ingoldianus]KAF2472666.1 LexA/Signal peptidase [Lindgomyces ingoldianus]
MSGAKPAPSTTPTSSSSSSRPTSRYPTLRSVYLVGLSCGIILLIRDNIVSIDTVKGSSMAPTLSPEAHETGRHDWVLIKRFGLRDYKNRRGEVEEWVKKGDIVTFWKPHKPEEISIKRVVAVEGDVRPSAYVTEGGVYHDDGSVTVPFGHVWVEGDNWRSSFDSNDFGPISKALIDGKAVGVFKRGLVKGIEDRREDGAKEGRRSRVVEGSSEVPKVFLY